jgi:hypothetical protein
LTRETPTGRVFVKEARRTLRGTGSISSAVVSAVFIISLRLVCNSSNFLIDSCIRAILAFTSDSSVPQARCRILIVTKEPPRAAITTENSTRHIRLALRDSLLCT